MTNEILLHLIVESSSRLVYYFVMLKKVGGFDCSICEIIVFKVEKMFFWRH